MPGYGQEGRVGISFQNSYGTANTASMHWLPNVSESIALSKPPLISEGMRGINDDGIHYEGANVIGGDLVIEATAIPLGVFLTAALGSPTTVTSGAVQTHAFLPLTADAQPLCAQRPFTTHKYFGIGSADTFSDMNGTTLELGISNGELLTATLGTVGGTEGRASAIAASYFNGKHFTWDNSSVSIAGAAISDIAQMTITVDNALEAMHTLNNSKYPSRIKRQGFRTVTVGGTVKFASSSEYQSFIDQTERRLLMHFQGATEVQSGYNESLTLDIPGLRMTEFAPQAGGPGEIEVSFSAKGVYDVTSAYSIKATLVNTIAGY